MMMIDNRVSERQTILHDVVNDSEMVDRHLRCRLALVEELRRDSLFSSTSFGFLEEFSSFRFACIPRLKSWDQVCENNNEVEGLKIMCAFAGITLFKIPTLVNDREGYVKMLYCKNLQEIKGL